MQDSLLHRKVQRPTAFLQLPNYHQAVPYVRKPVKRTTNTSKISDLLLRFLICKLHVQVCWEILGSLISNLVANQVERHIQKIQKNPFEKNNNLKAWYISWICTKTSFEKHTCTWQISGISFHYGPGLQMSWCHICN